MTLLDNPQEPEDSHLAFKEKPMPAGSQCWAESIYIVTPHNDDEVTRFNELEYLVALEQDENPVVKYGRVVLGVALIIPFITSFLSFSPARFFVPFTNWTLCFTTIYVWLCIIGTFRRSVGGRGVLDLRLQPTVHGYKKAMTFQAVLHVFHSFTFICNIVVVSLYWTLLHKGQMAEYSAPDQRIIRVHQRLVHSIPGVACLINGLITGIILKKQFIRLVQVVGISYSLWVFLAWELKGIQQYSFLDFRHPHFQAILRLVCIFVGSSGLYYALCRFEAYWKREQVDRYEQAMWKHELETSRWRQGSDVEFAEVESLVEGEDSEA